MYKILNAFLLAITQTSFAGIAISKSKETNTTTTLSTKYYDVILQSSGPTPKAGCSAAPQVSVGVLGEGLLLAFRVMVSVRV